MNYIKKAIGLLIVISSILLSTNHLNAQTISSHFFGQNAWMPDTIGDIKNAPEPPVVFNGKLHKEWQNIANSGAQSIRFGGIAPDKNMPTDYQYLKMIDSIRAKGMEPIMQVPFRNWRYSAQQAADIVKFVNVTSGRHVKYWVIGNEPDLGYSYTTSTQIAAYIKPFASAMKTADPSIMIIGPECAWFNTNIINGLTTPGGPDDITGKDANGRYYLDVISFHTYPFDGSQTRAQVVSKLASTGSLQDNLAYLNGRVANCNTAHGRAGSTALLTAITEANIDWQNSSTDDVYGVGANSFLGGQFWAEMMGIAMKNGVDFINFWSVAEGSSNAGNIGYIDAGTNTFKPSYYHFKMMADNFRGNSVNATGNVANVKTFASQSSAQICVMLMNEELSTQYNYTVKLGTGTVNGSNALKINVNAGLSVEYSDVLQAQSTVLLIFNSSGSLIKKYEYTLNNAVAHQAPTMTQYGTTPVSEIKDEGPGFEISKVYPNPTNAKFNIQLNKENTAGRKFDIEVFDIEGRLVLTKTSADFMKGKEEVDLTYRALSSGLYIARVKYGNDMRTAKVILAK